MKQLVPESTITLSLKQKSLRAQVFSQTNRQHEKKSPKTSQPHRHFKQNTKNHTKPKNTGKNQNQPTNRTHPACEAAPTYKLHYCQIKSRALHSLNKPNSSQTSTAISFLTFVIAHFFLSGCCMAQRCRCPGGRPSVSYKW